MSKVKNKCCHTFKKKGKLCKSCPKRISCTAAEMNQLIELVKGKKAKKKFEALYLA